MRRAHIKNRGQAILLILCSLFAFSMLEEPPAAYTQNTPITKENLIRSLRLKRLGTRKYVQLIRKYKVNFQMAPADEQEIRAVGKYLGSGLDELITAVRSNYFTVSKGQPTSGYKEPGIVYKNGLITISVFDRGESAEFNLALADQLFPYILVDVNQNGERDPGLDVSYTIVNDLIPCTQYLLNLGGWTKCGEFKSNAKVSVTNIAVDNGSRKIIRWVIPKSELSNTGQTVHFTVQVADKRQDSAQWWDFPLDSFAKGYPSDSFAETLKVRFTENSNTTTNTSHLTKLIADLDDLYFRGLPPEGKEPVEYYREDTKKMFDIAVAFLELMDKQGSVGDTGKFDSNISFYEKFESSIIQVAQRASIYLPVEGNKSHQWEITRLSIFIDIFEALKQKHLVNDSLSKQDISRFRGEFGRWFSQ